MEIAKASAQDAKLSTYFALTAQARSSSTVHGLHPLLCLHVASPLSGAIGLLVREAIQDAIDRQPTVYIGGLSALATYSSLDSLGGASKWRLGGKRLSRMGVIAHAQRSFQVESNRLA